MNNVRGHKTHSIRHSIIWHIGGDLRSIEEYKARVYLKLVVVSHWGQDSMSGWSDVQTVVSLDAHQNSTSSDRSATEESRAIDTSIDLHNSCHLRSIGGFPNVFNPIFSLLSLSPCLVSMILYGSHLHHHLTCRSAAALTIKTSTQIDDESLGVSAIATGWRLTPFRIILVSWVKVWQTWDAHRARWKYLIREWNIIFIREDVRDVKVVLLLASSCLRMDPSLAVFHWLVNVSL